MMNSKKGCKQKKTFKDSLCPNVIVFEILTFLEYDSINLNSMKSNTPIKDQLDCFGIFKKDRLRNIWFIFRSVKIYKRDQDIWFINRNKRTYINPVVIDLKRIQNLVLEKTNCIALGEWKSCPNMKKLQLVNCIYSESFLNRDRFPNLKTCILSKNKVIILDKKNAIKKTFKKLQNLTRLVLDNNKQYKEYNITNIISSSSFSKLKVLELRETRYSLMNIIQNITNLTFIYFWNTNVKDEFFERGSFKHLHTLHLWNEKNLTGKNWSPSLSHIESLYILGSKRFTDGFFQNMCFSNLVSLVIGGSNLTGLKWNHSMDPTIECIEFIQFYKFEDTFFQKHKFKKLKSLDLHHCVLITCQGWNKSIESTIENIEITSCEKIQKVPFKREHCPLLKKIIFSVKSPITELISF